MTLAEFLATGKDKNGSLVSTLNDLSALDAAIDHEVVTYRKIGGNEARQIFSMFGELDNIENSQSNASPVQIISGVNTTVGQLCKAMYATIQNGQFATDPATQDGQLNRGAADILEANGVISSVGKAAFFGAAVETNKPFKLATLADIKRNRGTISKVTLAPVNGWLRLKTTADCEKHNPDIYADIQGVERRVASFVGVEKADEYLAPVPKGYATLTVDDAYGVISTEVVV